jgi:hypothetical protein
MIDLNARTLPLNPSPRVHFSNSEVQDLRVPFVFNRPKGVGYSLNATMTATVDPVTHRAVEMTVATAAPVPPKRGTSKMLRAILTQPAEPIMYAANLALPAMLRTTCEEPVSA